MSAKDNWVAAGHTAPIIYLPMSSPESVGINEGTGGNFDLVGVVARSGRGPNQTNVPYSDLNGSADYLSRTTGVGASDTKTVTFSCVFNSDAASEDDILCIGGASTNFQVTRSVGGALLLTGRNSSTVVVVSISALLSPIITLGRNYHIVCSFDLSDTNKRHVYINGEDAGATFGTYTNDLIKLTAVSTYQVASRNNSNWWDGRLGNVFFHTSYIDLSVPSNLAKFCTGTGIDCKPVDMGANGELPLGTSPLIYLPMYANNAGKNYGTGGDFTVNSGPYTGSRGPNEFWGNKADFDGSTGYLYRTSALSGVSDSKTFSCSFIVGLDAGSIFNRLLSIEKASGQHYLLVSVNSSNNISFYAANSGGTNVLVALGSTTISSGSIYSVQVCVDLTDPAKRYIYINGVLETITWSTYTNSDIAFSLAGYQIIGAEWSGSAYQNLLNGKLSELYFTTEYIDFSQEANRLKFRDCFGNPCDLTAAIDAGDIPNPSIYLRFPPDNKGKNYGTGGDFSASGTISDGGQL